MKIMLNKEDIDELHNCIEKNIDFTVSIINNYVHNDELAAVLEEKFREILYYLDKAYNPELVELKRQSRVYYQKWLGLKDKDKSTANAVYLEYMKLKCKILEMEIPF
ncbi:hypothetical protein [Dehalobacterium formicoaceticum]|uniref:hypothetical protein n=1 Tax=Dehalobacterium formicoaceticum TaxID=51515 RepID=UPI0031F644D9